MTRKIEDGLTPKQRYFKKKWDEAKEIECACGCGERLKSVDSYARPVKYINGHNGRINEDGTNQTDWEVEKRYRVKYPDRIRKIKNRFRQRRKAKAIELKGGECVFCGLKHDGKNASVFDFHHLDPEYKEANISVLLVNKAWAKTVKELEQCVLACSNCHRMAHSEDYEDNLEEEPTDDIESGTIHRGRGFPSDSDLDG